MRLLCLIQEEELAQKLRNEAERLRWEMVHISEPTELSPTFLKTEPDVLVVQVNGTTDLEWWRRLNLDSQKPTVFLHIERNEDYYTQALEAGADVFLHIPQFSSRYFEARIHSLLRLQQLSRNKIYKSGLQLMIDSERCHAEVAGQALDLTFTEFKILRELTTHDGVTPRFAILTRALEQVEPTNRSLDVHVCALRKKVRAKGLDIESVRGVGYRLSLVSPPAR
jgi:DNA-binding response OmpR family regulator